MASGSSMSHYLPRAVEVVADVVVDVVVSSSLSLNIESGNKDIFVSDSNS